MQSPPDSNFSGTLKQWAAVGTLQTRRELLNEFVEHRSSLFLRSLGSPDSFCHVRRNRDVSPALAVAVHDSIAEIDLRPGKVRCGHVFVADEPVVIEVRNGQLPVVLGLEGSHVLESGDSERFSTRNLNYAARRRLHLPA